MQEIQIRRMTANDVDKVSEIEQDLFTMPWPETSFLFDVGDRRVSYPIVALDDGAIAGYAISWFISDELHIGNVAVARHMQGRGLGKLLLEHLLNVAQTRKIGYATLEVRVGNVRAINLYRRYGFKGVAIRRSYYSDTGEDALVMLATIGAADQNGWNHDESYCA